MRWTEALAAIERDGLRSIELGRGAADRPAAWEQAVGALGSPAER